MKIGGPTTKSTLLVIGRSSPLSIGNKILLYKSLITPIWTYGIQLYGCACKSNIAIIKRCQYKILQEIVDASWYVINAMIHEDLGIPTMQEVIHARSVQHRTKLHIRPNPLLHNIPRDNVVRRMKRRWPADM